MRNHPSSGMFYKITIDSASFLSRIFKHICCLQTPGIYCSMCVLGEQTHWTDYVVVVFGRNRIDIEADAQVEGSLAAEVGLIVLDTLELVVQVDKYYLYFLLESSL